MKRFNMKTPREFLLQRHQAAEPKLDALRQAALASLASTAASSPPAQSVPERKLRADAGCPGVSSLRVFLRSFRWHLAGMSAVWLLIALLNNEHSSPALAIAKQKDSSPRQILVALRENRRQMAHRPPPGCR